MATINSDIKVNRTPMQYHPDFATVVGKDARHALLLSSAETSRNAFFHTGCVLVREPSASSRRNSAGNGTGSVPIDDEVIYTTSNLLQTSSSSQLPAILISRVSLRRNSAGDVTAAEWTKLRPPMAMPAGAIPYQMKPAIARPSSGAGGRGSSGVLYCAQGNPGPGTSGLFYMPTGRPPINLLSNYYGRDFNSVYDVVQHPDDGSLWFTDPCIGFEQDFRKRPQMPCHVYRFHPDTGDLRVVADGLNRPAGICFGPDAATVYLTDADALYNNGGGSILGSNSGADMRRAATVYAYDVLRRGGSDFLTNKRVFAYALRGTPLGIRCDAAGNVYAGCADGVEVWNAGGVLLGVIEVPGGVSSFCLSHDGEMFLCSEQQLWWVHLKQTMESVPRWGAAPVPMTVDPDDNFI
ncbi:gluconolactonase [Sporothrix brasiliensis 5110]|uniref:Gluconolactonase n=1 Tax=Sporothrix brasiliensis 5110 TaxID=1398154 RepID=A0A0C2FCJ2_9PEZI|nr:gluconolactonase [Sporothrix brasiliensis 5110]KIH88838.1 gluconolactonase [Sporothrix brasiliensis 5110]